MTCGSPPRTGAANVNVARPSGAKPQLVHPAMTRQRVNEWIAGETRRRLLQRRDELRHRHPEARLLLRRQLSVLAPEERETVKRRHPGYLSESSSARNSSSE